MSSGDGSGRDAPSCATCAITPERREFLVHLGQTLAAVFVTIGIAPPVARALEVTTAAGYTSAPKERRYPLPATDGVQIDRDAEVILVRWQNAVYAFPLACPHQNTALKWNEKNARFQCPRHKSKYQPDGAFIEGRATRNMDRFSVARDGSAIVVLIDQLHQSDTELSGWADAAVHLS